MLTKFPSPYAELAVNLLVHYGFDLNGHTAIDLVTYWGKEYPHDWLHIGIIEALYQGRYKAISVQQILTFWQRRGCVYYHFNAEFERMICNKFPQILKQDSGTILSITTSLNLTRPRNGVKKVSPHSDNYHFQNHDLSEDLFMETHLASPPILPRNFPYNSSTPLKDVINREEKINHQSLSEPEPLSEVISVNINHPPIGQFTPESTNNSEVFTSKLIAMTIN
ncbi:MAG: hypothetical protein IV298_01505 [Cylindrospermopsis raciborskii KL1]|jgi:hypothetical protein|uniref:hypothetical protein n=1 Tax=Cylindrospermopsis raciborskii TaxID=77022 RepID=UPI001A19C84F|nr:hypothetical protein [Cylindrospermopsis raciborskii]MBG0742160.1 hypothetical protein [Cylindrospermopsis raciborskii KL1]